MCLIKEEKKKTLLTASDFNLFTMTRVMILNLVKLLKKKRFFTQKYYQRNFLLKKSK